MRVSPGNDLQEFSCVFYCACQRADSILMFADRNNEVSRGKTDCGLDAYDIVSGGGDNDATGRLGGVKC